MSRVWGAVIALSLMACGGGKSVRPQTATEQGRRVTSPEAVAKMAQGTASAREPGGAKRAAELFKQALEIDPGLWEARYNLGLVLAQEGALEEAKRELEATSKQAPHEESVVVALAEIERRQGRAKDGAARLGKFLEAHPKHTSARQAYGALLRDAGLHKQAMEQVQRLLVDKPGDAAALAELSLCYLAKGDDETAQMVAKQATAAADGKAAAKSAAKAHLAAAKVAFARGNDAEAFLAFQQASELDPSDAAPRLSMGAIYLRAGQFGKAEEQYRKALSQRGDDVGALLGLAIAERGQGSEQNPSKWGQAKATLDKALSLDKDNLGAHFNLGVLSMHFLKQPDQAKVSFSRFLKLAPSAHPDVPRAKAALAEIEAFQGAQ